METREELAATHTREAVAARLESPPPPSYLRDRVLGGIDGAVSTFAIVAGVAGAQLSARIVLALGLASLVADAFSMAAGNYGGVRAERENAARLANIEREHVRLVPQGEREEVRQLLSAKGFDGPLLEDAVAVITAERDRWVAFMVSEEHGASSATRQPMRAAAATAWAFLACGSVPLLPYALGIARPFTAALIATGTTFFAIGALRARFSPRRWYACAFETLAIGVTAAAVAYLIGRLLAPSGLQL